MNHQMAIRGILGFAFSVTSGLVGLSTAWAGPGGSGAHGGVAMVCRDSAGKVLRAELLDFHEGRRNLGLEIPEEDVGFVRGLVLRRMSLAFANSGGFDPHGHAIRSIERELQWLETHTEFYSPEEAEIIGTRDFDLPPVMARGCRYEQLANYGEDMILRVNRELFDLLSETARYGLLVHEAVYKVSRERTGATYSDESRLLVAQLFAKVDDEPALIAFWERAFREDPSFDPNVAHLELSLKELRDQAGKSAQLELVIRAPGDANTRGPGRVAYVVRRSSWRAESGMRLRRNVEELGRQDLFPGESSRQGLFEKPERDPMGYEQIALEAVSSSRAFQWELWVGDRMIRAESVRYVPYRNPSGKKSQKYQLVLSFKKK